MKYSIGKDKLEAIINYEVSFEIISCLYITNHGSVTHMQWHGQTE